MLNFIYLFINLTTLKSGPFFAVGPQFPLTEVTETEVLKYRIMRITS